MKIGMFDSGVGGLTVLKEFLKLMPNNEYIYVGDTKRLPYGDKSDEEIILFSNQIIKFLIKQQVDIIIVACGTVSAVALDQLKKMYNIPIIGIIEPTASAIGEKCNNVLVIATNATIRSNKWEDAILKNYSNKKIYSKACPLFVPIIEEGIIDGAVAEEIIKHYLNEYKNTNIESIVLGCTHYPIMIDTIRAVLGNEITLINPGEITALYVKDNYNVIDSNKSKFTIYLSDMNNKFISLGNKLLNKDITNIINTIDFE